MIKVTKMILLYDTIVYNIIYYNIYPTLWIYLLLSSFLYK